MIALFISIFLIVLGTSSFFLSINLAQYFQYLGYFILLICIILSFYKKSKNKSDIMIMYFPVFILFNIGILLQDLNNGTKLRLVFTMVVIETLALLSENLLDSYLKINIVCLSIFIAVLFTTIVAIITHMSLTSLAVEGIGGSSQGFNGGLNHKNSFGEDMLISLIGLVFCKGKTKFNKLNSLIIVAEILLIIISNARECYVWLIILLLYKFIYNLKFVNNIQKGLFIFVSLLFVIVIAINFYNYINNSSGSYGIRVQGLMNYLNMYSSDQFHMWFGNASMAFRDSGLSYEDNIRSVTGWNGTVELALLNILVKNGILGLIGYIWIFLVYIKKWICLKSSIFKEYAGAILILLLTSTLVQTSIVSIQALFGMVGYIFFLSFYNMGKKA